MGKQLSHYSTLVDRWSLVVFTVCTALLVSAQASFGQQKTVIKVGLIHPFTGGWAVGALSMKYAAEMRAQEIMEQDKTVEVQILSEDDGVKPEQGIAAANKLVEQDKVCAIMGALNSNVTLAIVPVLMKLEVPHFTPSLSPKITQLGSKYVFRMIPSDTLVQKQLAKYIVNKLGHKKVAIIYTNEEFGRAGAEAQREALKGLGLQPVAFEAFNLGEEDVTGQLTRIKASGATALSLNPGAPDAAKVCIQAKRLGLNLQTFGAAHLATPNFLDLAKDSAEGTITVTPFFADDPDPTIKATVKKFTERYKLPMDQWPAADYDGVSAVYCASKATKSTDSKLMAQWLHANGSCGKMMPGMKWEQNGDGIYDQHILQLKGGKLVMVERGGPVK